MSAPVDVLAVLGQIADGEGDTEVLAMRARAAVAELIDAAKVAREWIIEVGGHKGIQNAGTLLRLNSAIAKAGGAP